MLDHKFEKDAILPCANGNPLHIDLTEGNCVEAQIAMPCLADLPLSEVETVCADKGYDSDMLRESLEVCEVKGNIPRRKNSRKGNTHMDGYLYTLRHLVENTFARLKHFRAVATRYDKLKVHFRGFVILACCLIWLPL